MIHVSQRIFLVDDTNLIQARCVLKKNPCSKGYYEDERTNCVVCDASCSTCHGAGSLKCDSCAVGYANITYGWCRPCCGQTTDEDPHCEDCSKITPTQNSAMSTLKNHPSLFKTLFVAFFVIGFFILMILCCMKWFDESSNSSSSLLPFLNGNSSEKE